MDHVQDQSFLPLIEDAEGRPLGVDLQPGGRVYNAVAKVAAELSDRDTVATFEDFIAAICVGIAPVVVPSQSDPNWFVLQAPAAGAEKLYQWLLKAPGQGNLAEPWVPLYQALENWHTYVEANS